jgi:hypothetical protein
MHENTDLILKKNKVICKKMPLGMNAEELFSSKKAEFNEI